MIWSHALRFSASLTLVASDSDGGKVSCWAVTFVPCTGQNYTVAVFFPGTVSKDADAGFRALSLLLDPALDPSGEDEKVSIFKRLFPDQTTSS